MQLIEIDRFRATAGDGRVFTIIVTQELFEVPTFGEPKRALGRKKARTLEGYHANQVTDDEFYIVELELTVHRQ